MVELTARFRFNKVGQGCFYTGIFELNPGMKNGLSNDFAFVYDCGTESKQSFIKEEIRNFAKSFNKDRKVIDLLVISHFHKDHISHIEELICKVGKCKTVAMPYLTPSERLLLCLNSESLTEEYINFLEDPHSYLSNMGVENILYLTNNSDDDNPIPLEEPYPINPDEELNKIRLPLKIYKAEAQKTKRIFDVNESISDDAKSNTQYHLLNHKSYFSIDNIWEFRFYNKEIEKTKLIDFENNIKQLLSLNESDKITKNELSDYFNAQGIKDLKKLYKNSFKDLNNTSLALLHYPIINDKYVLKFYPRCRYKYLYYLDKKCLIRNYLYYLGAEFKSATLLTGDLNLKINRYNYFNELKTQFQDKLSEVTIMQIPHHGSNKNSNLKIYQDFTHLILLINNSGINNKHKHPSSDLMNKLMKLEKKVVFFNNEYQSFEYFIEIDDKQEVGGFIL